MSVCRRLAAIAFLVVLLARSAPAMVAYTTLEHVAATSDRILVGRVERVFQVPLGVCDADGLVSSRPRRVAEVRPVRWIKGGTGPESVFVLAEGTWTCDTSTAVPGETALLFLEAVSVDRSALTPWDWDDEPGMPEFRARAERALLALARSESVRLRRAAFRALALVGGEASLPAIERALRDKDPVVRINAVHGLGRIPTEEAAALGVALLASGDSWTRRTAAVALDALKAFRR